MSAPLTAKAVENVKPDPNRRLEIPDGTSKRGSANLYLVVQPKGSKGWAVRYRNAAGKPCKMTLGAYHAEAFSLARARERLKEIIDAVDRGIDPAAAKRAAKTAGETVTLPTTVNALADDYVKRYLRKQVRRSRAAEGEIDLHIRPRLGTVALSELSRAHGRAMVQEIAEKFPVAANRALARLNALMNWAVSEDLMPSNPMLGLKRPTVEAPRERVLSDAELAEVWKASHGLGYPAGDLIRMLILTGQRRDEVRAAAWSEFDLASRTWVIPTARFKGGRPHLVPLSDAVVERLEAMPFRDRGGFVFVGRKPGKPYQNVEKPKALLDKAIAEARGDGAATMPGWTLHDLRRSCRTGMSRLGIARDIAERVIGHSVGGKLDATYDLYEYREEKARALAAWANHVLAVVEGREAGDNVVALHA